MVSKDRRADWARSVRRPAVAGLPFCSSLLLMFEAPGVGFWLAFILAAPAAA